MAPGVNADILDAMVLSRIAQKLLTPERTQEIVAAVAARQRSGSTEAARTMEQLRERRTTVARKIKTLMNALADGVVQATDTFRETMATAEAELSRLADLILAQERLLESRIDAISLEEAGKLSTLLRERLLKSSPAMQKRIIRAVVKEVIVTDDQVVIAGAEAELAGIVTGSIKHELR